MAVANPSLPGVVPPGSVAGTVAAISAALVAIPVLTAEVTSKVTLVSPPPPAVVEEVRETELPALSGGGLHGSPLWSEPKAPGGDVAGMESECPMVARATEVVDIPSDNKTDDMAELPVLSRELPVVRSEDRPSSVLKETGLVWPCPEDPTKVRFILRDVQEC